MTSIHMDTRRELLASRPLNDTEELVLCRIKNPSGLPYATWKKRKDSAATYYGRYFATEGEARRDFHERS